GIDQEPAELGRLGSRCDDGNAADDLAIAFCDPQSLARGSGACELSEWAGDIGLERVIEPLLAGIKDAMQMDNGADVTRPEVCSNGWRWLSVVGMLHVEPVAPVIGGLHSGRGLRRLYAPFARPNRKPRERAADGPEQQLADRQET